MIICGILVWFGLDMFCKIQNSKIYHQRNQTIRLIADKLDGVNDDDIILVFGKYGGRDVVLDYEKKRSSNRHNWKWFSNPKTYKSITPSEKSGFLWFVILDNYLNSEGYLDTISNDKSFSIYKSKKAISDDSDKISILTAEILKNANSKNPLYNSFLSSVKDINKDVLLEMYSAPTVSKYYLNENLIQNGSFSEKGNHWYFPDSLNENDDFIFNSQDNVSFLTLRYRPEKRPHLSQNFAVLSGQFYRVSASFKNNENYKGDLLNAYLVIHLPNDKNGQYLSFYDTFRQWTSKSMIFQPKYDGNAVLQIWNGFANLPHETIADCTGVTIQREIHIDFNRNLLKNGNFTNSFNCWNLNKCDNEISIEAENDFTNIVKIVNSNGQGSFISQSLNIVSGLYYNVLFSVKKDESDSKSGAFLILRGFEFDKNKEHYLFMKNVKSKWEDKYIKVKANTSGKATLYLKTGNNKINETIYYKDVFVIEN